MVYSLNSYNDLNTWLVGDLEDDILLVRSVGKFIIPHEVRQTLLQLPPVPALDRL